MSSSRHAADVQTAVRDCLAPRASRGSFFPAGAPEPEGHPTDRVAPDPAVIDTDADSRYGHGVKGQSVVESAVAEVASTGAADASSQTTAAPDIASRSRAVTTSGTTWSEADRQAWLRRVQAER